MRDRLRVAVEHRAGAVEVLLFAAAHDGELAVLRADLAAGDGGVEKTNGTLRAGCGQFAGEFGGGGGVVDQDRTRGHRLQRAVRAMDDVPHIGIVTYAHHDEVGASGGLRRCVGGGARMLCGPAPGFVGGAVVHRHLVPGLSEVPGHGIAHDAEPEEGDTPSGVRLVGDCGHEKLLDGSGREGASRSRVAAQALRGGTSADAPHRGTVEKLGMIERLEVSERPSRGFRGRRDRFDVPWWADA